VWAFARDFNGHGDWHPIIAQSTVEDGKPSDQVGCIRNFTTTSGGHLREKLLAFSDQDRCFTYNILVSPMPIENYVATFALKPITAGNKTFVEWYATFDVGAQDEARIRKQVGEDTFAAGIIALEQAVKARN
jgi:hypothetical protein